MNAELSQREMPQAVQQAIARLDQGTVEIGVDCLWQLTARFVSRCPNAPRGTNCGGQRDK